MGLHIGDQQDAVFVAEAGEPQLDDSSRIIELKKKIFRAGSSATSHGCVAWEAIHFVRKASLSTPRNHGWLRYS